MTRRKAWQSTRDDEESGSDGSERHSMSAEIKYLSGKAMTLPKLSATT